jgi:cupin 2 domain-containing protein
MISLGNLFADVPQDLPAEQVVELLVAPNVRIERIVSTGQASAPGFWYEQDGPEWVILLSGSAGLEFDGEAAPRRLVPGDYVHIPARVRHRVAWTDAQTATVWLAVHYR